MTERAHHAALWLCVDNSSLGANSTLRRAQASKSGRCQEPGIFRRVRHFRTFQSEAPSAIAASAIPGQRSAENMSGDDLTMPDHRDDMSPLSRPSFPLNAETSFSTPSRVVENGTKKFKNPAIALYRKGLSARMKILRGNLTQQQVAASMQVSLEAYKKWEQRGSLPLDYVERFANLVGSTVGFVVTGREEMAERKRA